MAIGHLMKLVNAQPQTPQRLKLSSRVAHPAITKSSVLLARSLIICPPPSSVAAQKRHSLVRTALMDFGPTGNQTAIGTFGWGRGMGWGVASSSNTGWSAKAIVWER